MGEPRLSAIDARDVLEQHRRHRGAVVIDDAVSAMLAFASRSVEEARREERERCARVAEITPLEAYCTRAHQAQAAYNREQIVAAIRALPDAPERDGDEPAVKI